MSLSVVIPAHNAARTITRCLRSIAEQDVDQLQVIVVDDGSTDGLANRVAEFEADFELLFLRQENSGVSVARNHGVRCATGDWIAFVDADDVVPPRSWAPFLRFAAGSGADVVVGDFVMRRPAGDVTVANINTDRSVLGASDAPVLQRMCLASIGFGNRKNVGLLGAPWAKLYRRGFLAEAFPDGVLFRPGIPRSQDVLFNVEAFGKVSSVGYFRSAVYVYVLDASSSSHRGNASFLANVSVLVAALSEYVDATGARHLIPAVHRMCVTLFDEAVVRFGFRGDPSRLRELAEIPEFAAGIRGARLRDHSWPGRVKLATLKLRMYRVYGALVGLRRRRPEQAVVAEGAVTVVPERPGPGGSNRPRVLLVSLHYAPEPTGNAPYVASLAAGLVERGLDVRVLTTHPHYPSWRVWPGYGDWTRRERTDGVDVERLRHYVPTSPTGARRLLAELSFGCRAALRPWARPDAVVLVSPGLFSIVPAVLRARMRRRWVGVWVQDLYSLGVAETGQGGPAAARLVARVESTTLRLAKHVAVIHDRFGEYVTSALGVPARQVSVIRNWSHVPVPATADRRASRSALGWGEEVVALHAGNMGAKQGLENVVDAARLADETGTGVRFVLLGDGNQRAKLESRAHGVSSLDFVLPLPDEEYVSALASADVLLVNERPELREMSVPSKLTSYFAARRPVVAATAADSVTADEIAASGAGVRVDADDPAALLRAVMETAGDPLLAERLGSAGLRYRDAVLSREAALDRFARWLTTTER